MCVLDILMCSYTELNISHCIKGTDVRISTDYFPAMPEMCAVSFFVSPTSQIATCVTHTISE
jgi:hypothetical protein